MVSAACRKTAAMVSATACKTAAAKPATAAVETATGEASSAMTSAPAATRTTRVGSADRQRNGNDQGQHGWEGFHVALLALTLCGHARAVFPLAHSAFLRLSLYSARSMIFRDLTFASNSAVSAEPAPHSVFGVAAVPINKTLVRWARGCEREPGL
jgi:hypothetical protein